MKILLIILVSIALLVVMPDFLFILKSKILDKLIINKLQKQFNIPWSRDLTRFSKSYHSRLNPNCILLYDHGAKFYRCHMIGQVETYFQNIDPKDIPKIIKKQTKFLKFM